MIERWTPAEAAEHLAVPIQSLYRWLRGGHLRAEREGRMYWISTEDLLNFEPPGGERIRPAAPGESPRAGMIWGAAAVSMARARNRREFLAREWSAIKPVEEPQTIGTNNH